MTFYVKDNCGGLPPCRILTPPHLAQARMETLRAQGEQDTIGHNHAHRRTGLPCPER